VDRHEQAGRLADPLARLPDDHREVIVLRDPEGLAHEDVAARTGRAVGAVRMPWMRVLSRLRRELAFQGQPGPPPQHPRLPRTALRGLRSHTGGQKCRRSVEGRFDTSILRN
jgi:hypothetical protein